MRGARVMLVGWLQALAAAFQFLTRIPVPVSFEYTDAHFRRSVVFYPVAGFAIGGIVIAIGMLLERFLPAPIAGIMLVAVWTFLSGGLHLDGLMDTADGLLSHRSKERMLEIMKDSRVGAMGVIVCIFYLLLKIASVISLLQGDGRQWPVLLLSVPVWSRSFLATAIACWPYARREQGLGSLYRSVRGKHAVSSALAAAVLTLGILSACGRWNAPETGLLLLSFACVTFGIGFGIASAVSRKLGGLTGDVYGALNECIELGLLLGITIYAYNGG
ncbi:adenosylcobinamide-GDP ribazoletransferase [Cohnella sp. CFH 77786]|uniref:adenosylcobinamide-GDP ribazoletransferase n=1 Tax=Cohnella sp. CFH 77786 TaxID=2662265 RepID=UPI001C60DBA9|nr:adenosylcobinamide-GDP ribazoletransferase [Cohnella sp. CFH 77786]MBW5448015.1 adenosylcobinamide-GDP ribazoletransferase [Cohnella sp. CFH 77786]